MDKIIFQTDFHTIRLSQFFAIFKLIQCRGCSAFYILQRFSHLPWINYKIIRKSEDKTRFIYILPKDHTISPICEILEVIWCILNIAYRFLNTLYIWLLALYLCTLYDLTNFSYSNEYLQKVRFMIWHFCKTLQAGRYLCISIINILCRSTGKVTECRYNTKVINLQG